jgi:hypothetical protein
MNPDLMITIAFGLWAVLAWGAWGLLVGHGIRSEKRESRARSAGPDRRDRPGLRREELAAASALSKTNPRNEAPAA